MAIKIEVYTHSINALVLDRKIRLVIDVSTLSQLHCVTPPMCSAVLEKMETRTEARQFGQGYMEEVSILAHRALM